MKLCLSFEGSIEKTKFYLQLYVVCGTTLEALDDDFEFEELMFSELLRVSCSTA